MENGNQCNSVQYNFYPTSSNEKYTWSPSRGNQIIEASKVKLLWQQMQFKRKHALPIYFTRLLNNEVESHFSFFTGYLLYEEHSFWSNGNLGPKGNLPDEEAKWKSGSWFQILGYNLTKGNWKWFKSCCINHHACAYQSVLTHSARAKGRHIHDLICMQEELSTVELETILLETWISLAVPFACKGSLETARKQGVIK